MFGGITETVGKVTSLITSNDCLNIQISPSQAFDDLKIGDSISVSGTCLTVTHIIDNTFSVTVVPESLRLTNLSCLGLQSEVNLERALAINNRIGGHYVQGHVDFCGEIISLLRDGRSASLVQISYPPSFSNYIIKKGYITLDGMSITVVDVSEHSFFVTLIPHTQQVSMAQHYQVGTKVNIEVDIIGKYIEKIMGAYSHDRT